jgi:uncharacterized membrane protein
MSMWFLIVCQASVLALAALGGVFLAFSDFIMRSLNVTGAPGGIAAMQAINREVFRYVFMALFLGMVPVSALVLWYGYVYLTGPVAVLLIAGALIYVVASFGVTAAFNVPLNTALDGLAPDSEAARTFWQAEYLPKWTFWNTVRTCACFASSAAYLFALTGQGTT